MGSGFARVSRHWIVGRLCRCPRVVRTTGGTAGHPPADRPTGVRVTYLRNCAADNGGLRRGNPLHAPADSSGGHDGFLQAGADGIPDRDGGGHVVRRHAGDAALVYVIGAVVDERGEPIGNAQVTPIGMAVSTTTDSAGRFMLVGVPASPLPRLRAQKIDFRPSVTTVQLVADRIQLGITRTTVSEATALSRHASTLSIPAGACRMLQILVPSTGGQRTLRLRVTSP